MKSENLNLLRNFHADNIFKLSSVIIRVIVKKMLAFSNSLRTFTKTKDHNLCKGLDNMLNIPVTEDVLLNVSLSNL